jgi:hypothetical protein
MVIVLRLLFAAFLARLRSRSRLEIEILVLRHQLNVLRRTASRRVRVIGSERLLFVWLYRLWPGVLGSVSILRPETVVRWHRLVQIHAHTQAPIRADLVDLPSEPCRWDCIDRPVRGANDHIQTAVRPRDSTAQPPVGRNNSMRCVMPPDGRRGATRRALAHCRSRCSARDVLVVLMRMEHAARSIGVGAND